MAWNKISYVEVIRSFQFFLVFKETCAKYIPAFLLQKNQATQRRIIFQAWLSFVHLTLFLCRHRNLRGGWKGKEKKVYVACIMGSYATDVCNLC